MTDPQNQKTPLEQLVERLDRLTTDDVTRFAGPFLQVVRATAAEQAAVAAYDAWFTADDSDSSLGERLEADVTRTERELRDLLEQLNDLLA